MQRFFADVLAPLEARWTPLVNEGISALVELDDIRATVVMAIAHDDTLGELLVLKGGNALRLVHGLGLRTSQDLDYSVKDDLDSPETIRDVLESALAREFVPRGYTVFDVKLHARPPADRATDPRWGGWRVEFKLLSTEAFKKHQNDPRRAVRALDLYGNKKAFQIDISKYEYVESAEDRPFRESFVRVYTLEMIAYEKLRALCQQIRGEPSSVPHPRPRPRDFVDISALIEAAKNQILSRCSLLPRIFAAKNVPTRLLRRLASEREHHRVGWVKVEAELGANSLGFDSYFDRVICFVEELDALGVV